VRFNEANLIIIDVDDTGDPQQEVGPWRWIPSDGDRL